MPNVLGLTSYRQISTFGHGTIRKFAANSSEMKKLAARDFEDLLQVPVLCDYWFNVDLVRGVNNRIWETDEAIQGPYLLSIFNHWVASGGSCSNEGANLEIWTDWNTGQCVTPSLWFVMDYTDLINRHIWIVNTKTSASQYPHCQVPFPWWLCPAHTFIWNFRFILNATRMWYS